MYFLPVWCGTIPVAFLAGYDPVKSGLVASLARPGGNLTGISMLATELLAKRLELLRELVPAAARVAVLVNPSNAVIAETQAKDLEAAARAKGLQVYVFNASTSREVDAAFASLVRERCEALFVGTDPFFGSRRVQLVHLATLNKVPATYGGRQYPEIGGLMSYGTDVMDAPVRGLYWSYSQGRQAGRPAGRPGEQIRAGHQRPDRQNARPHRAADAALDRRRGDRIAVLSVASAHSRFWQILLQKSFCTRDQNFFWLYRRLPCKYVWYLIV